MLDNEESSEELTPYEASKKHWGTFNWLFPDLVKMEQSAMNGEIGFFDSESAKALAARQDILDILKNDYEIGK